MDDAAACEALLGVPQRRRLLERHGLDAALAEAVTHGYWKLALLWPDEVLLLPRVAEAARALDREAAVMRALAEAGLAGGIIARITAGPFRDAKLWPLPMLRVSRLHGQPLWQRMETIDRDGLAVILADLGRHMAAWHSLPPDNLPEPLRRPVRAKSGPRIAHSAWVDLATTATGRAVAVDHALRRLGRQPALAGIPDLQARWLRGLRPLARLSPCLIHADLHEAQILVDGDTVSGVFDWESACVRHPAMEFDLNEWDKTLWSRFLPDFPALRAAWWGGYAKARGLDPDPRPLNLFHALWRSLAEPRPDFLAQLAAATKDI